MSSTYKVWLSGDASGLQRVIKSTSARFKKLGQEMAGFGAKMSLGLSAPILLAGNNFKNLARDAAEMESKFDAVFKGTSASTKKWAEQFGDQVGVATQDMMEMAAGVQDLFVPMGFGVEQAAGLSTSLSQLAVDVGSFNNAASTDVMENFRSALVGGHESVAKYGIIINESTIKQELMRMGALGLTGAAKEQAKVQARLNLIIKGTSDAHGDATRTSESLANQEKALSADFKELRTELGEKLMPIWSKLVKWARDLVDRFKGLDDSTQIIIITIAGLVAAIGPVLVALGAMASGFGIVVSAIGVLFSPIALVVAAIAGIAFAAYKFRDDIAEAFAPIGDFIYESLWKPFDEVMSWLLRKFAGFISFFVEGWAKAFDAIGADEIAEKIRSVGDVLTEFSDGTGPVIESAVMAAGDLAIKAADIIGDKIGVIVDTTKEKIASLTSSTGDALLTLGESAGVGGEGETEELSDEDKLAKEQELADAKAGIQTASSDKFVANKGKELKADAKGWAALGQQALAGNKKLGAANKAFAVGSIVMDTAQAIGKAIASAPFPANIPAIAFATATGATQLATAKGQFHSGIDSVPSSGTYLLEKGERVVDKRLNADLKGYLGQGGNTSTNSTSVSMSFGNDPDPDAVESNRGAIESILREIYDENAIPAPF